MDKINKALRQLSAKEKKQIRDILIRIKSGNLSGLDIHKLAGRKNIYRVRKGDLRIIYKTTKSETSILAIERRSESTYKGIR